MSSFDLRIEQIKRLRGAASENRSEGIELRQEAAANPAAAGQLLIQAGQADQLMRGWDDMAEVLWRQVVTDEAAVLAHLTQDQRRGNDCFVCAGPITIEEPDERLGELKWHHVFAHVDHKVCDRVLGLTAVVHDYTQAHKGEACMICFGPFEPGELRAQTGFHGSQQLYCHGRCVNPGPAVPQASLADICRPVAAEQPAALDGAR